MAEHTTWQVTDTATNQTSVNQAGNVVEGVITYFITGTGGEGSVFTPNGQFTEARVTAQINEAARKLDGVRGLKGRVG